MREGSLGTMRDVQVRDEKQYKLYICNIYTWT